MFENVKEHFGKIGAENPTYNGEFFDNIGSIVLGMTDEDINNLPEDTELLTIIDILSKYEDEMDSSQVTQTIGQVRKTMIMHICKTRHFNVKWYWVPFFLLYMRVVFFLFFCCCFF